MAKRPRSVATSRDVRSRLRGFAGAANDAAGLGAAPLEVESLIDRALGPGDWVDLFAAMLVASKKGNASAASILVGNRFGKPRPSAPRDARYLSVIQFIDPSDPGPPPWQESERDG